MLTTIFLFIMQGVSWGQTKTYNVSGTYTVPAGVTSITIQAWGGGGAGGNITGGNTIGITRGGGGGAYARRTINVTPGTEYTVVVGYGGRTEQNQGVSGNPSSFGPGPLILAAGGGGGSSNTSGNGGTGGTVAGSIGDIVYRGGNAVAGGGGGAGSTGQGGDTNGTIGGSGTIENGGNGGTVPTENNNGNSGFNFGGGGSGAIKTSNGGPQTGGSGAHGQVIISWCQLPSIINQPSGQNVTYGESAVFSVSSSADGVTYQWQVSADNGDTWSVLAGEEGTTLSFTLPTVAMSGNLYRCVLSVDCGSFSTSNAATLTVIKKQLTVTAGNQTVTYGTPESTVTQNGTCSLSGFVNGENSSVISGLNSISYTTNYTSSNDAGTSGATITPSINGLSAGNYSFAAASGTITINKADQYIVSGMFPFTKPLNEFKNEPVPLNITANSGLPVNITLEPGSAATLNYDGNESSSFFLTDIGDTGFVTIYINQPGNVNYNAAVEVTRVFDVTKSNQSISFPEIDDMTYSNGLTLDLEAVASSGLAVAYTVESGPATVSGNSLNITGAGEIWVTASQEGDASYNPASDVTRSFTVNKGTQTITINIPAEPLTESTQISAASTSGLPVTLTLGTGSDASGLVDQGAYYTLTGIGSVGSGEIYIVGNQAGNDNFLPANQVIQAIDLDKDNQTINFNSIANQTYSPSLTVSLAATATSGLTVSFALISGPATLTGSTLTITGAGTVVVEVRQNGDSNYNPAPKVTQQFVVKKATPVITQSDISKTFGDADFAINPTSDSDGLFGFVSGDTEIFTISGNTATILGAGTTVFDITQQPTANYFGATKTIAFTVIKASSTISITGDTDYTYNASPQGPETSVVTGSTGTISYSYVGTGSSSYGPNATKPINSGTYTLTATVTEDLNYAGATSVPCAFTISKADAAINVNPYSVIYNGTEYLSSGSAIGVSSENLSGLDLSGTAHTNAGNYTDTWTFTDVTGNYNNASGTVENTINPKSLTITATGQMKCFGNEFNFSGTEFTSSGLVTGETVGSVTLSSSGTASAAAAGSYVIVPSGANGGTFNPNNYAISYVNGQMTVKPQPSLSGALQAATVCEGSFATIDLSGLLPEKIFSLDYTIDGVAQTTKTGLYSDASGNSSFTTPTLSLAYNGQTLQITGITITSETPNCSQIFSEEVTIGVNPLPTLSGATLVETVCEGASATINLSGLLAGTSFTLYYTIDDIDQTPITGIVADASGNGAFITPVLSAANNGQVLQIYGIEITSETPACYQGFAQNVILEIATETTISNHPSSTAQNFCQDETPNDLSVTASGSNLSFQWYSNTVNSNTGGALIDGATSISNTPSTSIPGTLYYYCVVTGDCGTVTSNVSGAITVNENLTVSVRIDVSPFGPVCEGTNVTFTATPANGGSNPTYQWKVNGTNVGDDNNIYSYVPVDGDVVSCVLTSDADCVEGAATTPITYFSWDDDTKAVTDSDTGLDAISIGGGQYIAGGIGGTTALGPITVPKTDIVLNFGNNPAFNTDGVDYSISYRRSESVGQFFTRGNSLIISGGSVFNVSYRISDGAGSFTTVSSSNFTISDDATFHNYRFTYDPSDGYGRLFIDATEVWTSSATPGKAMYWAGAGDLIVGANIDASGNPVPTFDNLSIKGISLKTADDEVTLIVNPLPATGEIIPD